MHRPDFFRRDVTSIRPYRFTLPTKMTKKTTIFILNGFFNVFCSLLMYPLAKKEGNFLWMYPLFVFPYLRTLQAVFSETMCFSAAIGGHQTLIDAPFRYKHSSFCSRRLGVSSPPLPENLWRDFSFRFSLQVVSKNSHCRSISHTTDFGHLIALPFRC